MLKKTILPFLVFLVLLVFLALGLNRDPSEIPSPFIGKAAPQFELAGLDPDQGTVSPGSMIGKVWILNVWASWCVACREEHPLLNDLSSRGIVSIIGLNYKDERQDAIAWLANFGNPYTGIAVDRSGQVGIDYGVYGVPETFVIDRKGIVRMKHIGPLTREDIEQTLIPLLDALDQQEG